jgi:hypothetical protein
MSQKNPSGWCNDPRHVRPSRRDFMYVGLIGGLGLSLGDFFGQQSTARAAQAVADAHGGPSKEGKAKSVIHIFLPGGMAQHESFDPKPTAPIEYRGPLGTCKTSLEGEVFGECMQNTAKIADKITVIRSMTHGEAAHERGTHNMFTGYRPNPALKFPSFGSIVSHELGTRNNLPPYVCIPSMPNEFAGSGYLSSAFGPFSLGSDPGVKGGKFTVRDLSMAGGIDDKRFGRRRDMLATVDDHFKTLEKSDNLDAMDSFYQRAYAMISSKEAREAFNLSAESEAVKDQYGRTQAGGRLLMARRLDEAGTRFVSLTYGGWDHHAGIQNAFTRQMPDLDKAFAALITDLEQRGMLDSTLVMVSSEFGRTPKINKDAGRDHWPRVFSVVLAGGGIKKGLIHGTSDSTGGEPASDAVTVENLSATIYKQIGIDPNKRLIAPGNRPIDIVNGGKPINELIA